MSSRDMTGAVWRKSRASNGQAECVEVAFAQGAVATRDSKRPEAGMLVFAPGEWLTFVGRLEDEEFQRR